MTSSPAPATAAVAMQKAWLQPVVIATAPGAMSPPYSRDSDPASASRRAGSPRIGV